ncbi:unnamed protein product, partial [Phaeothamnion confervicola]
VPIGLSETPTEMLLCLRSSVVATDFRDYDKFQREKAEYERRCAERAGSERSVEQHAQTTNWALKNKEVMAATPATKDMSCAVNTWEIFD